MKTLALIALIPLTFIVSGCQKVSDAPTLRVAPKTASPAVMPDFAYRDLSGNLYDMPWFSERTVLIEFWATWCSPCRELEPDILSFYKEYGHRAQLISVSVDDQLSDVKLHAQKKHLAYPIIHIGPEATQAWQIKKIPALALVRNGRVIGTWEGEANVRDALNSIKKEIL